jgi:biopolymer transport protein ExbB/TolQ
MSPVTRFLDILASGGVPMAAVVVTAAIVVLMTLRSLHAVARARPEDRALLETRIDSILFWGVFAAIPGLLGTLGGLAQMAGAIEAAGTVNPALLWGGVRVALSTTIAGTSVLGVALPAWYLLRRRWLAPT